MNGKQPGVMLYFSMRACLKRLSLEEKGALFEAILDYAEHDIVPDLNEKLMVAWDFVQPQIDRDRDAYRKKCEKARQSAATRWNRERDADCTPHSTESERMRTHADVCETMPHMPIPIPITKPTSITIPPIPPEFHPAPDFEAERQRQIQQLRDWDPDKM